MKKKKILVDLDVVTVAYWDKSENGDLGRELVSKVKRKRLDMATPLYLLQHLEKWKYIILKEKIEDFYIKNSVILLTNEDVDSKIDKLAIDDGKILLELQSLGVKEEDAFIVLITSIFHLDCLVTLNRRHLKSKENEINKVLKKNGISTIKIVGPEEV